VNEHRISFEGAVEFKSAEFIQEMKEVLPPEALMKYRVGDPAIKEKCVSREWWLAMVQVILDNYTDTPLTVMVHEERPQSLIELFMQDYEWTKNQDDMVLGSDLTGYGPKIKAELKQLGIVFKKCNTREHRGKWIYVGIKLKETIGQ
jgi:hypothetical protein